MQFATVPLVLSALPFTLAAYGNANAAAATTTGSAAASATSNNPSDPTHTVLVGSGGLSFSPSSLQADVGTKVEFHFYPQQHSVAQSSFAKPCEPLNSTAFFSGPFKTASGVNETVFTIEVNSTAPIWYYCAAPNHCGKGMVGAINPTAEKTFDAFQNTATGQNTTVPASVQGGVLSASSGNGSTSAGVEVRGSVAWTGMITAFAAAVGVGAMMY